MSTYLLFKDFVNEENLSSITHTVSFGTDTQLTDEERIVDRSVMKSYAWSTSSPASVSYITVTLTDDVDVSGLALIGCHVGINSNSNMQILLRNSGGSTIYGTSDPDITKHRQIDGVDLIDYAWVFDEISNVRSFRIYCDNETQTSPLYSPLLQIGKLFAGQAVEIEVKPASLNYSFQTQGEKVRTEGGQVIASKATSYMECKFTTAATKESNIVDKHFEINYRSSISEPIIFIPQIDEEIMLYGTQKKTSSTQTVLGKKEGQWLYETSFQLEEEL